MQFHLQFESDVAEPEGHFPEYKIMINPGAKVSEAVVNFKNMLSQQCGSFRALGSVPHITLASFQLDETREDLLIKYLDKFSSTLTPFPVWVKDFGFFDSVNNHGVAYVAVENKDSIVHLQTMLNVVLKIDVRVQKRYLLKTAVPHITIGRALNAEKLSASKELFSGQKFASDFSVDKLVLLKRNEDKLLEVCKEFYFF